MLIPVLFISTLVHLFSIDYNYTKNSNDKDIYIPTSDDYDELIRDFSMVKSTRKQAYVKSDALNYLDFINKIF